MGKYCNDEKGAGTKTADILIRGNAIYDSIIPEPFSGFVAVKKGRIIAVGPIDDASEFIGFDTKTIEAGNRLVLAGFHESHAHLILAGMYQSQVNLSGARSEEEAALMVRKAADDSLEKEGWVIGFSWYHIFWDYKKMPTKRSLDRLFPDRPVFLLSAEGHGGWVNSKALEIAGINRDTVDPFGGEIIKDSSGEPTGVLDESATGLVTKYAFSLKSEQEKQMISAYLENARKFGITSMNDMQPYFHGNLGNLEIYNQMDKEDYLTARIHVAVDLLGDLDEAEKWRLKYRSEKLRVEHLKQFLDGVITTHTALVLEPYTDLPGNYGKSIMDTDAIREAVPEAHRRGFSIKLHAVGDKAVRMGLDYFENAIKMYGKKDCRHAIEHLEMVAQEDIGRFGELGIIPSVQPEHMAITEKFEDSPYFKTIGHARSDKTWPLKSLYDAAGILAIGSDCPVVDSNPFLEIYRAVARLYNDGNPPGGWNSTEKLSLHETLRSYTYGSAFGASRENELGTLEQGKFADIIVLDRNLFAVSPEEILESRVDITIMDGRVVYDYNGEFY